MLRTIWIVCICLSLLSIIALACLLAVRALRQRGERREKILSARLTRQIVTWLHEPAVDIDQLRAAARRTPHLASRLLVHSVGLLEGEDRARLVALSYELGLQARMLTDLAHGKPGLRERSAETLAFFDTEEIVAALYTALTDPAPQVRLAAARALATLGRNIPTPALRDPAWGDSALVYDLFEKVSVTQSPELAALARDEHASPGRRIFAARALATTGNYALIPLFAEMSSASCPDLRATAAEAMGLLGHPRAQETLATLLNDNEWNVRAVAAQATGRLQLIKLYEHLAQLLEDHYWWVSFMAAQALLAGGPQGLAVLHRIAASGATVARDIASLALLENKKKEE